MLSKVEHIEHLRELPVGKRLLYSLVLALIVAVTFLGAIALAVLIETILFTIIDGSAPTLEELLELSVPVILAFLSAIGFTSNPSMLGQTVQQMARRAARFGAINGFITGALFGLLWTFIQRLTAAVWFESLDVFVQREVLVFALVLGVTISPAVALYRAITSVIETVALNFVRR